jgi:hypothetical protein
MTAQVRQSSFQQIYSATSMTSSEPNAPINLLRVIATDIHFWIPLVVLAGGLLLLDNLR